MLSYNVDASVENFGGGCGSSYKYTCTAQESDYPNCTLHDPLSDLDCEGVDLSQDIGVRCQTREETCRVINDEPTPLGMMSTGPISDYKTTTSTTRLVMASNILENKIATEASLICSKEALGTLLGLLAAVLVVVTIGWIVSCVYLMRRNKQR